MIENTSESMKDPANAALFLATAMGQGGSDRAIAEQERAGQSQLVHSDQLPTRINGPREDFEALGFSFGEPDPRDPMFRPATLPEGWKREGSEHAMWSYILDGLGRRRASVFYKAAFYDRDAFMSLATVSGYLSECVYNEQPIVTDDTWATPGAVAEAARELARYADEEVQTWTRLDNAKYVAEFTAKRERYLAIATRFKAASEA